MANSYIFDMKRYKVILNAGQVNGWANGNCFELKQVSDSIVHEAGADGFVSIAKTNDNRKLVTLKLSRGSVWNSKIQALTEAFDLTNIPNMVMSVIDGNTTSVFKTIMVADFVIPIKDRPDISVGNTATSDVQWDFLAVNCISSFPEFSFVF